VTDRWTDRLSEYVDGSLDAGEALALEAHLPGCANCAETLAALRTVAKRAAELPSREPERDLWPAIAARLSPRRAPRSSLADFMRDLFEGFTARRLSFSVPQLAAASLALVLVSGGAVWIAFRARPAATPVTAPAPGPVAQQPTLAPGATSVGFEQYDSAIAELESVLAQRRTSLDTSTVRVVEQNLAAIDRAIAEARRALAADPTDPYLHDHLANTMRRKMGLLRRLTAAAYST
jgi:anti-sigma factor RsiW